jgi:hypothetical protein
VLLARRPETGLALLFLSAALALSEVAFLILSPVFVFLNRAGFLGRLAEALIWAFTLSEGRLSFEPPPSVEDLAFATDSDADPRFEREALGFVVRFIDTLIPFRVFALVLSCVFDLAVFTAGALALAFAAFVVFVVFVVFVFLVDAVLCFFPNIDVRALVTTFLIPVLSGLAVRRLRFLLRRDVDSSSTRSALRFLPMIEELAPFFS